MRNSIKIISVTVLVLPVLFFLYSKFIIHERASISEVLRDIGFIEIRPPSNLTPPGTWVSVVSENPLSVTIICPPERALGEDLQERLMRSESVDREVASKLSGEFSISNALHSEIKADNRFDSIENISVKLLNVGIIEVPTDAVVAGIRSRDQDCKDAISFLKDTGKVSMIKSVLIADAYYDIGFSSSVESAVEQNLKKEIALKFDLRVKAENSGSLSIVGKGLIWGIREDSNLAKIGLELPSTGGEQLASVEKTTDTIPLGSGISAENGPATIQFKPLRRVFSDEEVIVSHSVNPIRQTSAMSCWAAVYSMMDSWKSNRKRTTSEVIAELGEPWTDYYLKDQGLPANQQRKFISTVDMKSLPPASYSLEAYIEMLSEKGPLWIVTGDGLSSHARLLIGIYGSGKKSGIEAYRDTTFEFIDPIDGSYSYSNALDFVNSFESEARWLVDNKLTDIEFRDQIIYW